MMGLWKFSNGGVKFSNDFAKKENKAITEPNFNECQRCSDARLILITQKPRLGKPGLSKIC